MASEVNSATELCALGIWELAERYRDRSLSPVEVTQATLDRIAQVDPNTQLLHHPLPQAALASAKAAEQLFQHGIDLGPLQGVPASIKDLIRIKGARTTCASPILLDAPIDQQDATVVTRLRRAGAVLVGKNNLHEFAAGVPDPNGPFGWVQNPRRLGHQSGNLQSAPQPRSPPGSAFFSVGTDTAQSVRQPATFCGVVGLKPTYGRVPIDNIVPLSTSLDHVGPLARSVADIAYVLQELAGPVRLRSEQLPDASRRLRRRAETKPTRSSSRRSNQQPLPRSPACGVRSVRQRASRPCRPRPQPAPLRFPAWRRRWISPSGSPRSKPPPIMSAIVAAKANTAKASSRSSYQAASFQSLQFVQALQAMESIRADWLDLFEQFDIIATPACPIVAPPHGLWEVEIAGTIRFVRIFVSRFTRAFNLTVPRHLLPFPPLPEGLPPDPANSPPLRRSPPPLGLPRP